MFFCRLVVSSFFDLRLCENFVKTMVIPAAPFINNAFPGASFNLFGAFSYSFAVMLELHRGVVPGGDLSGLIAVDNLHFLFFFYSGRQTREDTLLCLLPMSTVY